MERGFALVSLKDFYHQAATIDETKFLRFHIYRRRFAGGCDADNLHFAFETTHSNPLGLLAACLLS